MSNWVRVGKISECPPGMVLERVAGERVIALCNAEGKLFAIDGVCPHQGGPLGEGELVGTTLGCPWHGWQFDITTGQHQLNRRVRQPQFPVRVEGDDIYVNIEPDAAPAAE
ncbi:MAG TPA: Rieske 2Fe-2S domain-containing protein [Pirellulales bacterium]|jgi:nitrite reductase (NADH) small subunit|nr:Rieske 2Fe-2S domain-containing protein [Pirellulales bacterium]